MSNNFHLLRNPFDNAIFFDFSGCSLALCFSCALVRLAGGVEHNLIAQSLC